MYSSDDSRQVIDISRDIASAENGGRGTVRPWPGVVDDQQLDGPHDFWPMPTAQDPTLSKHHFTRHGDRGPAT